MSERKLWRWALIVGVATFVFSRGFALFEGLATCATPPGWGAILALEYARDGAAAAAVVTGETCRGAQVGALWWDVLGFIPLYAAFLILAALAAGGKLRMLAVALTVVAALADWVEGVMLFRILDAMPGSPGDYAILIPAVRVKFALLAVATLLVGGRLAQRRGWLILPGVAVVLGSAMAAVSTMPDARAPFIMPAMTLAWVALLVTAGIMAFRRQPA